MSFAWIELECQRSDCDAEERIELDQGHANEPLDRIISENTPGWGWDTAGYDHVLHCPEHRTPEIPMPAGHPAAPFQPPDRS